MQEICHAPEHAANNVPNSVMGMFRRQIILYRLLALCTVRQNLTEGNMVGENRFMWRSFANGFSLVDSQF